MHIFCILEPNYPWLEYLLEGQESSSCKGQVSSGTGHKINKDIREENWFHLAVIFKFHFQMLVQGDHLVIFARHEHKM